MFFLRENGFSSFRLVKNILKLKILLSDRKGWNFGYEAEFFAVTQCNVNKLDLLLETHLFKKKENGEGRAGKSAFTTIRFDTCTPKNCCVNLR